MKRKMPLWAITLILGSILLPIFILYICNNVKSLSLEQSKENFVYYENMFKRILKEYSLELEKIPNSNFKDTPIQEFSIIINDTQYINIRLSNSCYADKTGREEFLITYKKQNSTDEFNKALFIKLVNAVSGKTITEDYIEKFLSAVEDQYSPEKHGLVKRDNEIIRKYDVLNFGEDWRISYSLFDNKTEELFFVGLTSKGTK